MDLIKIDPVETFPSEQEPSKDQEKFKRSEQSDESYDDPTDSSSSDSENDDADFKIKANVNQRVEVEVDKDFQQSKGSQHPSKIKIAPKSIKTYNNNVERGCVSDEEIELVTEAHHLSPNEPEVILRLCFTLADWMRKFNPNQDTGIIKFGKYQKFSGIRHIVGFLKEYTKKILTIDPTSLRMNLGIAKIFNSTVPFYCRDTRFAKLCFERALIFNPNSAKVNFKMGCFALSAEKNMPVALNYFNNAFAIDSTDFGSLTSILYCQLSCLKNLEEEASFISMLGQQIDSEDEGVEWTEEHLAHLWFIKAIYGLLKEDHIATGLAFIIALDSSPNELKTCLERLSATCKRYGLPTDTLSLLNISNMLKPLLESAPKNRTQSLKKVRSLVKSVGKKEFYENEKKAVTAFMFNMKLVDSAATTSSNSSNVSNAFKSRRFCNDYFNMDASSVELDEEGNPIKPPEAFQALCLGEQLDASKQKIKMAYRKLCEELMARKSDKNITKEEAKEIVEKVEEINWAFGILYR